MLRLSGTQRPTYEGVSHRDLLPMGGLGALEFGLSIHFQPNEFQVLATGTFPAFGPGKSCILLYRYDARMQHNKPDAPVRIHEEMQATDSRN